MYSKATLNFVLNVVWLCAYEVSQEMQVHSEKVIRESTVSLFFLKQHTFFLCII